MTKGTHLVISTATELVRVAVRQILYVKSDGNYSTLYMTGGEMRMLSFQLGQIEKMIADQIPDAGGTFVRIGRGLIINLNYIYLINLAKQQLVLADMHQGLHTLSASREALASLKKLIEDNV
ncbi:MAG: LytTR family transcriptional regulator DNA-binding domain-containing protein [Paludibacteraceae bacterium]|nr:LytTR family transcriptional regulator DNA-binding domain-containing protein [Paludibacteraceae bacterium]